MPKQPAVYILASSETVLFTLA